MVLSILLLRQREEVPGSSLFLLAGWRASVRDSSLLVGWMVPLHLSGFFLSLLPDLLSRSLLQGHERANQNPLGNADIYDSIKEPTRRKPF